MFEEVKAHQVDYIYEGRTTDTVLSISHVIFHCTAPKDSMRCVALHERKLKYWEVNCLAQNYAALMVSGTRDSDPGFSWGKVDLGFQPRSLETSARSLILPLLDGLL